MYIYKLKVHIKEFECLYKNSYYSSDLMKHKL